jgi:hypothetical protein
MSDAFMLSDPISQIRSKNNSMFVKFSILHTVVSARLFSWFSNIFVNCPSSSMLLFFIHKESLLYTSHRSGGAVESTRFLHVFSSTLVQMSSLLLLCLTFVSVGVYTAGCVQLPLI